MPGPILVPDDFRAIDAPLLVRLPGADPTRPVELRVDTVGELPPHALRAAPFSVILRGPREAGLQQQTYAVEHPRLGVIELFLVPLGPDAEGARYEATFN